VILAAARKLETQFFIAVPTSHSSAMVSIRRQPFGGRNAGTGPRARPKSGLEPAQDCTAARPRRQGLNRECETVRAEKCKGDRQRRLAVTRCANGLSRRPKHPVFRDPVQEAEKMVAHLVGFEYRLCGGSMQGVI
jgi:hypothetical protein